MTRYLVTISGSDRATMLNLPRLYGIRVFRSTTRRNDVAQEYSVDALIEDAQVGFLESKGYRVQILEDVDEASKARLAQFDAGDTYLSVTAVESALDDLQNLHPGLVQRVALPHTTWEGRTCHAIKIANGANPGRLAVYFIAGLHAREWACPDSLVYFAQHLVQAYGANTSLTLGGKTFTAGQIQDIVNKLDIILFPQVNPDGRHHSQTVDTMWRKNRRPGPAGSAACIGVDINRNFGFLWNFPDYFDPGADVVNSTDPCDYEVYIGPAAASEPETQNVISIFDDYANIRFFVDVHSYSKKVMYNWGDDQNQTSDPAQTFLNSAYDGKRGIDADALYREYIAGRDQGLEIGLANEIRAGIQAVRGKVYQVESSFDLYPTAGTSTDYTYSRASIDPFKRRIYAFCIECGEGTFQPGSVERGWIIQEVTAGLLQFCLGVMAAPGDVYVRDNLLDTGEEPLPGGGISCSPDIHHFRQQLIDPQATLGSTAAMARDDLFEDIEVGQPNYIYVRLQNRWFQPLGADIDVYWTPPSTLPTPVTWHLLGTLNAHTITPGKVKVAGPLTWAQGDIPEQGHYCFVAVLGNAQDPKPNLNAVHTPNDFYNLIRQSNNVTWKNFDVKDMFAGSYQRFDFRVQGCATTCLRQ